MDVDDIDKLHLMNTKKIYRTVCGRDMLEVRSTDDINEVTCSLCLKRYSRYYSQHFRDKNIQKDILYLYNFGYNKHQIVEEIKFQDRNKKRKRYIDLKLVEDILKFNLVE
jgi:hypothetical protein